MSFRLHITTDNAAFDDDPSSEVVRILTRTALDLPRLGAEGETEGVLHDHNGNRVGKWTYTERGDDG